MIKCALQYILEIKSNQMLVLEERGKPEYPEKNLSEQSREPTNSTHIQSHSLEIKSNQMLVLEERGKPEYPEKNLSEQSREPTNSTHI